MFNKKNSNTNLPKDLTKDLSKLLKEEVDFVQELSDVSTKAAEFHARLESIEKAIGDNPSIYNSKEADDVVQKAKEKYSLVLLSNDVSEWSEYITEFFGLNKYFSHKIVSGDIGLRKPDIRMFDTCLERIGATAAECIFVDNTAKNLVAAEETGISCVLFDRDGDHFEGASVVNFEELSSILL